MSTVRDQSAAASGKAATSPVKETSLGTRMVFSALGGMGAATVCHPIDVVRVQMQLFEYKGTVDATMAILRRGGASAVYNGISAAYLRQWTYGSCRLGIFSFLLQRFKTRQAEKGLPQAVPFTTKLGFGALSGGIGAFVGNPAELALVRMSADGKLPLAERRNYSSVVDCVVRTVKEEGVSALWRGSAPTVARAVLLSASTQACYSEAKEILNQWSPSVFREGSIVTMFSGTMIASLAANIICTPFDVVKSRIQNMPTPKPGEPPMYSGMVDCFSQGIRAEGIGFLYRGFTPAFIKLAPYTTISLILVDKLTTHFTGRSAY